MVLKLEETHDFEDRINLIRNMESMIRLPRPLVQLFLIKLDVHFVVSKIMLGELNSQTSRTNQLAYLQEELNIACFDFIGELVKQNKRCLSMFEIQLGERNLNRIMDKAFTQVVDSNLFLRSVMISIMFFFDTSKDLLFIEQSIICKRVLENTKGIIHGLLREIRD